MSSGLGAPVDPIHIECIKRLKSLLVQGETVCFHG